MSLALALAFGALMLLGEHLERGAVAHRPPPQPPLALPPVVAALLGFVMFTYSGLVARRCYALGLIAAPGEFPPLLHAPHGAGIEPTHLFLVTPVFTRLGMRLAARLDLLRLLELAQALGASRAQAVGLPLFWRAARPVVAVCRLALGGASQI